LLSSTQLVNGWIWFAAHWQLHHLCSYCHLYIYMEEIVLEKCSVKSLRKTTPESFKNHYKMPEIASHYHNYIVDFITWFLKNVVIINIHQIQLFCMTLKVFLPIMRIFIVIRAIVPKTTSFHGVFTFFEACSWNILISPIFFFTIANIFQIK
jgi:hypothetical protein